MNEGSKIIEIVIRKLAIMRYIVKCEGQNLSEKCDWSKKLSVKCDSDPPITTLINVYLCTETGQVINLSHVISQCNSSVYLDMKVIGYFNGDRFPIQQ